VPCSNFLQTKLWALDCEVQYFSKLTVAKSNSIKKLHSHDCDETWWCDKNTFSDPTCKFSKNLKSRETASTFSEPRYLWKSQQFHHFPQHLRLSCKDVEVFGLSAHLPFDFRRAGHRVTPLYALPHTFENLVKSVKSDLAAQKKKMLRATHVKE